LDIVGLQWNDTLCPKGYHWQMYRKACFMVESWNKIQDQLTGPSRKISNLSKERWSIWFPCKSSICCMSDQRKAQNVISKTKKIRHHPPLGTWTTVTKENACMLSVQCSPEKFHVNGSVVLIFSLEWKSREVSSMF